MFAGSPDAGSATSLATSLFLLFFTLATERLQARARPQRRVPEIPGSVRRVFGGSFGHRQATLSLAQYTRAAPGPGTLKPHTRDARRRQTRDARKSRAAVARETEKPRKRANGEPWNGSSDRQDAKIHLTIMAMWCMINLTIMAIRRMIHLTVTHSTTVVRLSMVAH